MKAQELKFTQPLNTFLKKEATRNQNNNLEIVCLLFIPYQESFFKRCLIFL